MILKIKTEEVFQVRLPMLNLKVTSKDVGHYGGSVALADYCPYIQVFSRTVIQRFGEEALFICRSSPGGATMLLYEEAIVCTRRTNPVSSNNIIFLFGMRHVVVVISGFF